MPHCYDESVPEICSCGAELVPDARFCHRCGKPTREDVVAEQAAVPEPVILETPAALSESLHPAEISFGNTNAVRVALLVAAIAMMVYVPLAGVSLLGIVLPTLAAGLLAVFLYQRRTGAFLTVMAGARLGWITGVFIFAFFLVLFTLASIPAMESGEFAKIPDQALAGKIPQAEIEKVKEVLGNPALLSVFILFFMLIYFVGATVLTSLGGMLGAKFLGRDPRLQR